MSDDKKEPVMPDWAIEQANARELVRLTINSYRANTLKIGLHRIEPGDNALAEGLVLAMEKVARYVLKQEDSDDELNHLMETFENDLVNTTLDELNVVARDFALTETDPTVDYEGEPREVIAKRVREMLIELGKKNMQLLSGEERLRMQLNRTPKKSKADVYRLAVVTAAQVGVQLLPFDLNGLLQDIEHAHAVGPILDPTLYREKVDVMELDKELLRAALPLRAHMQKLKELVQGRFEAQIAELAKKAEENNG